MEGKQESMEALHLCKRESMSTQQVAQKIIAILPGKRWVAIRNEHICKCLGKFHTAIPDQVHRHGKSQTVYM